MCAIAGVLSWDGKKPLEEKCLDKMQETMGRRGPDQKGRYLAGAAALLHNRLAVIDLENGKQPMSFLRGSQEFALVYNGELYNTPELRAELETRGYRFDGRSDTEVLLKAYAEWGERCVEKLNGIFAFAVWEAHRKRLFLARDRMGVKPLFYSRKDGVFLFASDIKTLLAHPLVEPVVKPEGIAEVMLIGPGRTPGCGVFRDIRELRPAQCGFADRDGLKVRQYWRLEDRRHEDSFEKTVEKVRFLVTDAIERQLVSDVPLCTFLSGGLDSSLISSVASSRFKKKGEKLHTFSVDYLDNQKYFQAGKFQPDSDTAFIGKMNRFLEAEHHDVVLDTPDLAAALEDAVEARDLPGMADVDSSLLLFCREIKRFGTVALSGECADEIFGGYPWYRDPDIRRIDGFPWAQSTSYRNSFLKKEWQAELRAGEFVEQKYRDALREVPKCAGLSAQESRMREMMYLNLTWFMQTLLERKDRMSMYQSLEVRVPFCDFRIVEYLYSVPWEYKDYQGVEKGLLRKAMEGLLPKEVLWRKKSPYPKTHHPSYLQEVSRRLRRMIQDSDSPVLQLVEKGRLLDLLDNGGDSRPWYGQLMTAPQTIAYFLQVDDWMRSYHVTIEK